MPAVQPVWVPPKSPPANVHKSLKDYPRAMRQLLYNRGFRTAEEAEIFLQIDGPSRRSAQDLSGWKPFLKMIREAAAEKQRIMIYGDYDVDGITSAAVLHQALQKIGADSEIYLPDRAKEGYGLNIPALEQIAEDGVSLVITVDCGIRAVAEIDFAKDLGLNVIITDHHQPGKVLPSADLIINPHLDGPAGDPDLAGVGVAYKVVELLSQDFPHLHPEDYLELVALGTVADVVPLQGENRLLVRQGIRQLRNTHNQGLFSLIRIAGLEISRLSAADISFQLAPRINAAGRLGNARIALDLLLETDPVRTGVLAQKLELLNNRRKESTRWVVEAVEQTAEQIDSGAPLLFAADPAFDRGVVGIAAGNLSRKYHRPTLIGQKLEEVSVFSCRSIPGFDITAALNECRDLLLEFGGHSKAAGLKIPNQNLREFRTRITEIAAEKLGDQEIQPRLQADASVQLEELTDRLLADLELLEPTGELNPRPIFWIENAALSSIKLVGKDRSHLKCTVRQGNLTIPGIGFYLGKQADSLADSVDLLVQFEENIFRGKSEKQLIILAIRKSGQ